MLTRGGTFVYPVNPDGHLGSPTALPALVDVWRLTWYSDNPVLTPTSGVGRLSGFSIARGAMAVGTSFTCALDSGAGAPCAGSWTAPALSAGRHSLVVTGIEPTGRRAVSARTWSTDTGSYTPTRATRILDTRSGLGAPKVRVAAGQAVTVTVPGLPADATAVTLNVTAVGASAGTFLVAYPAGTTPPATSSVNVPGAAPVANLVTVKVAPGGKVSIRNSLGLLDVIADLQGYYATGSGYRYTSVAPIRIVDTRSGLGGETGPISWIGVTHPVGSLTPYPVIDVTAARALTVNLTAVGPSAAGYLTAYDYDGAGRPGTSNLNFGAWQTVANLATVPATATSHLAFAHGGAGTVNVLADLAGFFGPRGSAFTAVTPQRIVDTRFGTGVPKARVGAGQSITVTVPGLPTGTSAVAVNLTAVSPSSAGYLVAYPTGTARPNASAVNFPAGRTVANAAVVGVDGQGRITLTNATGTADVLVDLSGYYAF